MSTQSKTMPMLDLKVFVRVVAAVFCISSATAFVFALMRLLYPDFFYLEELLGSNLIIHYFITGLMMVSSGIGFLNSAVVVHRSGVRNSGRNITTWLLLDSLFETSRVVYVFLCEIVLKGKGPVQIYDLLVSAAQYFIHYFITGLMMVSSGIGFLNSAVVVHRSGVRNSGRNITTWLLLDSLFETSRVVYVFLCEIVLKGKGPVQIYDLLVSAAQYLLDSFLYCQMILRH